MGRLRRFLSPQLAELIVSSGDESLLESHRRRIAVVFYDLRGFTAFSETTDPEEVIGVVQEYHAAMGALIHRFEGTMGPFAGDGLMVFFNDPLPCPDPAPRAVRMAVAMRERMRELHARWRRRGYELDFGVGIAIGYATLGRQILISQQVHAEVEDLVAAERMPDFTLKGFHRLVPAFNAVGLKVGASPEGGAAESAPAARGAGQRGED